MIVQSNRSLYERRKSILTQLTPVILTLSITVTGCEYGADNAKEPSTQSTTTINEFEDKFVKRMLLLQKNQVIEYESQKQIATMVADDVKTLADEQTNIFEHTVLRPNQPDEGQNVEGTQTTLNTTPDQPLDVSAAAMDTDSVADDSEGYYKEPDNTADDSEGYYKEPDITVEDSEGYYKEPDNPTDEDALQNAQDTASASSQLPSSQLSNTMSNGSGLGNGKLATDITELQGNDKNKLNSLQLKLILEDLPITDTPIPPPKALTEDQIRKRYQSAMQSLYVDKETTMPSRDMDMLINIATLTPHIFGDKELLERLVAKTPSLARMLQQYQKWEQIESHQMSEIEALKQAQIKQQKQQQREFDALVVEYNKAIEGFDRQIENYEARLKEFE